MTNEQYYELIRPYEDVSRIMPTKLERLELTDSVMNAKDHLMDIAGIRVICYFPEEIQFRTMSMDFWASMEHRSLFRKSKFQQ